MKREKEKEREGRVRGFIGQGIGERTVWKEGNTGLEMAASTAAYCVAPARVRIPDLPRANTQRRP